MKTPILSTLILVSIFFLMYSISFAQQVQLHNKSVADEDLFYPQLLNNPQNSDQLHKRWTLDVGGGLISGPYVTQLKDVFKSIELQGCYNTFFGQECYPKDRLALGFTVALKKQISHRFALGLKVGKSYILGVEGYRDGNRALIGNRVLTVAPIFNYAIKNYFLFGFGPAYQDMKVRFTKEDGSGLLDITPHTQMGFIAEAEGVYPPQGSLYGKIQLSYLYSGRTEIGPYQISPQVLFPKNTVSFNQIFFNVGFGVRL